MKQIILITAALLLAPSCMTGSEQASGPADKNATPATAKLLASMKSATEKGIMFGHQDDLSYGVDWVWPQGESDVKRVCGDYPAVIGMDLGGLELMSPYNLDSVPFVNSRLFAVQTFSRGGITTFSWHAFNPLTGGNTWDVSSDRVVASVLPGGEKHELFKSWLDNLALFFLSLRDSTGTPVPVIFRPYHEHTGSWFWWGKKLCTPDQFKALWQFTFEYLTEEKGVHNLLFAYSSSGDIKKADDYLERYPGDEYVDIVGFDHYQMPADGSRAFISKVSGVLDIICSVAKQHGKIAAVTEAGYETLPDPLWWTGTLWPAVMNHRISYVLVWRNAIDRKNHYYAPYPGQVSAPDFVTFHALPRTLFLNDAEKLGLYK